MFERIRAWSPWTWVVALGGAALAGLAGFEVYKHYGPKKDESTSPPGGGPKDIPLGGGVMLSPEAACNEAIGALPKDSRITSDSGTIFGSVELPSYQEIASLALDESKKTGNPEPLRKVADLIHSAIESNELDAKYAEAEKCLRTMADSVKSSSPGAGPGGLEEKVMPAVGRAAILARRGRI